MSYSSSRPPIAVVGASALFPGSVGATQFWRNILDGTDLISDVPSSHWLIEDYYSPDPNVPDMTYGKRGGFLPNVDFDPLRWGIPPAIIPATDTTQLLALILARKCMEDAHHGDFSQTDLSKISCILGVTSAQELLCNMASRLQHPIWLKALRENGIPEEEAQKICLDIASNYTDWQESTFPGLLGNVVAGRIANRLDLGGTNCVTDAACASTFSAVAMAVNELYLGDSDLVLAGGTDTMNDIFMHMCFSKTPALSKSGDCRPFSDQADGTLLGEGLAIFALKRLKDAQRDGNPIYAVIKGVGSSSDGRSKSVYAPLSEGQAKAVVRAYERGGIPRDSVELIEAHGTGTKAGDAAEFGGLCLAFEGSSSDIALGSVKSQIGHTKSAAGAAGLFKTVFALRHSVLPPTIKVDRPNPKLDIENTPFYLNTSARPWIRGSDHPRRAGVSSFGFGGSNFHIALEEYRGEGQAAKLRVCPQELFVLSAPDSDALRKRLQSVLQRTKSSLVFESHQSQQSYRADEHRLAIVASSLSDLHVKIEHVLEKMGTSFSTPTGIHYQVGGDLGAVAFLFPGQGSQFPHMGKELALHFDDARSVWDEAADWSPSEERFSDVVFPVPVFDEEGRTAQSAHLTKTEWAQPTIGLCSLSQLRILHKMGLRPQFCAGHSYGEVTALHAAGVLSTEDFVRVSRKRGELMALAAEQPGSMSAVRSDAESLQKKLDEWGLDVVIANHNGPRQVVISGDTAAIAQAEEKLKEEGIFATRLNVATAFHSTIVAGAVEPFASFLSEIEFKAPQLRVYANTTAKEYEAKRLRETLSGQISSSVRFVDMIQQLYADGARVFVEVGPKFTLSKLAGRILRRKKDVQIISMNKGQPNGLASFLGGIAQLICAGWEPNFSTLWDGYRTPQDPQEQSEPKMKVSINGTNYKKPYPPQGGAAALPKPNPTPKPVLKSSIESSKTPNPVANHTPRVIAKPQSKDMSKDKTHPKDPLAAPAARSEHRNVAQSKAVDSNWLHAFQSLQNQTAQAHTAYQTAMSNAHLAYLNAAQTSLNALASLAGAPVVAQETIAPIAPPPPAVIPQPAPPVIVSQPISTPTPPVVKESIPTPPKRTPVPAPQTTIPVSTSALNLESLLLEVVSEKTGYPSDMLGMEMNLEGDLGVDSIKRVEILSAMQE
ncbi:MAG: beta-ketoacyl synthase N-terminal-like domain-containing protein, partial [Myxococcota bacterium]|nr:beta-ketoacyl synthase N-terminal-like domain-containing protein [Myxococcota bacterium]